MKSTLLLYFLCWFGFPTLSQSSDLEFYRSSGVPPLVVMQPTGEQVNGLPVMQAVSDTSALYRRTMALVDRSFMNEIINLYFLAQNYLVNTGTLPGVGPAYLALTLNEGGYARTGFYLLDNGKLVDKSQTRYVDILEKNVWADPARLMSLTQLYPHEMGHVIYGLLSADPSRQSESRQVDIHFFSMITDYATAFSEGFSEHIENAARQYEPDEAIKAGIFDDIEVVKKRVRHPSRALARDYQWPLRLGYYRSGMILWYQRLEDLKRYTQALDKSVRFKNATLGLRHQENELSYRNAGVQQRQGEVRNLVQAMATEGVINSFFTHLLFSELPGQFRPPAFYQPFLADTNLVVNDPSVAFSPLQNQFLKNFYVLHHFVRREYTERSQLTDFIEGYLESFPEEAERVKGIFQEVTGLEYENELPPECWLLVKGYHHRLVVLDQFGALTVPVYTFMLNAAEPEDLITIPGVDRKAAQTIVAYRADHGFFYEPGQVKNIPGLPKEAAIAVQNAAFDQSYFDNLPQPDLNIQALIWTPVGHLLLRGGIYFLVILLVGYVFFFRGKHHGVHRIVGMGLLNLLYWLLFLAAGLAAMVFYQQQPLLVFIPFWLLLFLLTVLLYRKKPQRRHNNLVMTGFMGVLIFYSLL